MSDWNAKIIDEFRSNSGKVASFGGASLLLLHTTGARSGQDRVAPVVYHDLGGGSVAIFASKAGAPTHPDWYHNLVAEPSVTAEMGTETRAFRARVATGDERERIWAKQKQAQPGFAEYEQKTDRQIPVIVLDPAGCHGPDGLATLSIAPL
jgi:deazaflavin-dependent oxidoreductase (nitroreductase family)